MPGDFKATPFARLFFDIFWKGLVRKSTIWALLIFLQLQNFSGTIWSLEFTASSSKSLEGFRKGANFCYYFDVKGAQDISEYFI